jgi:recombination protein RecA
MDDKFFESELGEACTSVNKDLKLPIALPGKAYCASDVRCFVPTSSFLLNKLLSGGVPVGRVMEVFGDPSKGKSTLVEHMMIGFQRYPGISVLLDAETGWYRPRAEAMGHNSSRHIHLQADTVELGFKSIFRLIERLRQPGSKIPRNMPVGIFWDTISASQTEGEKSGDIYKDGMNDKPRKIRLSLRKIAPILAQNMCAMVFVSQTYQEMPKPGQRAPAGKVSASGGEGIKFWSAKRIKVWHEGKLDVPVENAGINVVAQTVKDKLQAPFLKAHLPVMHKTGIDPGYELLNYLIDNSTYANMSGARVHIPDFPNAGEDLSFYPKELHKKLEQHPDLLSHMEMYAELAWAESST